MQHPAGAEFNDETMRMELMDSGEMPFNPDAQARLVHTVSPGRHRGDVRAGARRGIGVCSRAVSFRR